MRIGHGQMRERELEQLMVDFYHRRFNLLVCTTIIESGIDVPSANTILINRADRLGLAQLHQLRGRVGRSHHRAYAYLIVPSRKALTGDAAKRLEAIESLEELGRRLRARDARPGDPRRRGIPRRSAERRAQRGRTEHVPRHARAGGDARCARGANPRSSARWPPAAKSSCTCRRCCRKDYVAGRAPAAGALPAHRGGRRHRAAGHDRRADRPLRRAARARPHLLRLAGLRLRARALGMRRLELGPPAAACSSRSTTGSMPRA